jgi:GTP cyclohydrolase I
MSRVADRAADAAPFVSGVTGLASPVDAVGAVDLVAAEAAIAQLLTALGQDAASERLRATPGRAAAALLALVVSPGAPAVKLMPAEGYRGLVLVRDIPFQSVCEHHLLPFRGRVHAGFLPGDHLVGLSTIARAVEHVAHGLQLQERMTQQLHDWLQLELTPRGAGVVVQAEHLCMSFRGIGTSDTQLMTEVFSGALRDDLAARSAFFGTDSSGADSSGTDSSGTDSLLPPIERHS